MIQQNNIQMYISRLNAIIVQEITLGLKIAGMQLPLGKHAPKKIVRFNQEEHKNESC